jgi:hypothetical protein
MNSAKAKNRSACGTIFYHFRRANGENNPVSSRSEVKNSIEPKSCPSLILMNRLLNRFLNKSIHSPDRFSEGYSSCLRILSVFPLLIKVHITKQLLAKLILPGIAHTKSTLQTGSNTSGDNLCLIKFQSVGCIVFAGFC